MKQRLLNSNNFLTILFIDVGLLYKVHLKKYGCIRTFLLRQLASTACYVVFEVLNVVRITLAR